MGLNPGELDREIVLLTGTTQQNPTSGEEIIVWPAVTSVDEAAGVDGAEVVWAAWRPAGTREAWQAQQRLGAYVDGVLLIYDQSPRPTADRTRILFEGVLYDVKPVIEIGRGEGLQVPVTARVA